MAISGEYQRLSMTESWLRRAREGSRAGVFYFLRFNESGTSRSWHLPSHVAPRSWALDQQCSWLCLPFTQTLPFEESKQNTSILGNVAEAKKEPLDRAKSLSKKPTVGLHIVPLTFGFIGVWSQTCLLLLWQLINPARSIGISQSAIKISPAIILHIGQHVFLSDSHRFLDV